MKDRRLPGTDFPTVASRTAVGRAARERLPRGKLAEWSPLPDRPAPSDFIATQETYRNPALLPLRHHRMSESPFAFYRGSSSIMAYDLGTRRETTGLMVQLCGDAHLANFGLFATPDRSMVFDLNDFDETCPGPFEWDVARLVSSFVLAARQNGFEGADKDNCSRAAAIAYQKAMATYAGMPELDIWYDRLDLPRLRTIIFDRDGKKGLKRGRSYLAQARARDRWSAVAKLTRTTAKGRRKFINDPPLLTRTPLNRKSAEKLHAQYEAYRLSLAGAAAEVLGRYRIMDIGHKVVGVGSIGLPAYVYLLQGRDESDLLVLQAKQAVASVIATYHPPASEMSHGQRVVRGQWLIQAASDSFLGWFDGSHGQSYYVRQLRDMTWSVDVSQMDPRSLATYATLCGMALARAHARSGDAIAIDAYLGTSQKFADSMAEFGKVYARQAEQDYTDFKRSIASGKTTCSDLDELPGDFDPAQT